MHFDWYGNSRGYGCEIAEQCATRRSGVCDVCSRLETTRTVMGSHVTEAAPRSAITSASRKAPMGVCCSVDAALRARSSLTTSVSGSWPTHFLQ